MNPNLETRLEKIFDCAAYEIMASGGDGDGIIVFQQTSIKDVADIFEKWSAKRLYGPWLPHRHEINENHIFFSDDSNENITFVSRNEFEKLSSKSWHDEIVMEVW